ncbi:autotransporter domain-containing protein [Labrenzia sp. 011]|uniref:autotransporter domain-containing protein n=1 Tax=Labrenzia sp. 011 TaxID=2171494 RepID=UPI00140288DE|nr:autotransporter domain-containing protein [Labrenzia sp. 011]
MLATALTGSLVLVSLLTTPARAQSLTWDTTTGDSSVVGWSGTWDGSALTWTDNAGATNQAWTPGAQAIFGGTAGTVTVSGAQTVGGLSFNSSGYTLTGDALTLTAGGNEINVATGTATISLRPSDGAGYVGMRKTGGGTLVLANFTEIYGMITVEEGTLRTTQVNALNGTGDGVTVNSGATFEVAATQSIDDFVGSGNTVIASGQTLSVGSNSASSTGLYSGVISGAGNFAIFAAKTLSGDNTFTGQLIVEFGMTTVTGSLATEDIVIEEDLTWGIGDLNVAGDGDAISDTAVIDNRGILTLTGNDETIGAVFGAGDINLKNNTLTTGDAADREISGVISGTGGLAKQGSGTLTLSGTNTATGTLTNNAGTVVAGSWAGDVTNNATFDLTGTSTVGGTFTNNAAGSVTNSGGGAVQLTGLTNFIGNGSIGSAAGSITVNTQNLTYRDGHSETGTVTFNVSDTITEERTAGPTWSGTGHTTNFATAAAGVFTTGGDFTTTGTLTHTSSAALTVSAGDTLRASAVTNASGSTINVQTGASLVGTGNTANNSGTVNVAGGGSLVELTGDYNNLAGGIVNFNDAGAKTFDVQAGVITNAGTLNFNAGTTAVNSVGGAFQNSGTGDINIANGATLNAAGDTITNAGTIDMLGSSSVLTADTLTNNTGGVVNAQGTLTGAVTNQGGGDFNITGDLTGVTAFTNTGTATFDIGSGTTSTIGSLTNTTTGGSGTTVASSATLNVTGTIENGLASGAAASVITNNWTLTGDTIVNHAGATLNSNTATSHLDATGGSLTNNGTMNVRGQLDAATTINNGSSAVFNVTGATARSGVAAFVNENGAILNISGGALDRTSLNNTSGGSGSTLATAGVQIEAGGELTAATVSNSGSGTLYNAGTITGDVTNSATAHSTGTITGDVANTGAMQLEGILTGSLTNSGTGTVTLTGNLTGVTTLTQNGTGPLTVSGGATLTNSSGIVGGLGGSNGTVTVTGTGSTWTNSSGLTVGDAGAGALTLSAGGTVNASGTVTLASQAGSTGTLNIGSASGDTAIAAGIFAPGVIAFGAGDGEIVFNHTDTNYTFDADISGDGSISVLSGTTKLTGTNSYTGGTTVTAGTLQVGDGGTSGSLSGDVTNNGALIFNRSDALSYGGEISGTGSLTKSGAGTLTLTGTNTHTGGTTVTAGTLQVGDGGTSGSFSGDVTNNGALIFNRSDAMSYGGEISGTGSLTKSGVGTLTLTGTNTHTGGTTVTAGTLQVGDGGTSGSLSGDVTNNGALIFNRSDALSYGGEISGTGSLTKSGAGTLTLTGTNTHTGGTTVTAGTLQVGDGGTSGSFSGDVTNNSALIFNRSDALSYGGEISGTGSLTKSGAGTLTLTGTNTHTGGTTVTAGTLQVGDGGTSGSFSGDVTNNSALIFNRSDALSYGGEISGTGSLTKSGAGTLTLIGTNSYTGGTTVWSGVLTVNGSTGDITLNGGTLGGSGTVGSVTAKSGSTIAPGNSIGTLNISGNTSFASGSTYAVEVDKNGNSDRIVATGTVTIDSGATVSVSPENGTDDGSTYSVATTYTMLTANTGVTGTFGSVTDTFAFLDASLSYDANNVYLKLFRNDFLFTTFAMTPNQRATAGALDTLGSGNAVYDAVSVLGETDARAAFDSLSGEVQASVNTLMIQQSSLARDAVGDRIRTAFDSIASGEMQMIAFNGEGEAPAVPGDDTYAWGQAYGNWGRSKGDGNAGTMDHVSGGFFMGVDASLFDGWRGGVIAGYGNTSFDVDARASSGSADSYTLGAYAGNQLNALGLRAGASYSWHDVSTSRSVTAGTLHNTLSADYSAATAQLFAEAGFTVNTQIARFEPFAGAALIHQSNDSFTETGGAAALSVAAASQTLGITSLGLRTERQVAAGDTFTATLTGSLAWQHAFGDRDATSIMRFDSGGDPFEITGLPLDSDTVLIQAGIDLDFGQNINLTAGYNGDLGINAQNHAFSARMAARF